MSWKKRPATGPPVDSMDRLSEFSASAARRVRSVDGVAEALAAAASLVADVGAGVVVPGQVRASRPILSSHHDHDDERCGDRQAATGGGATARKSAQAHKDPQDDFRTCVVPGAGASPSAPGTVFGHSSDEQPVW